MRFSFKFLGWIFSVTVIVIINYTFVEIKPCPNKPTLALSDRSSYNNISNRGDFSMYGGNYNANNEPVDASKKMRNVFTYNKNMPLIFVTGVPESGLGLMKSLLDMHPSVSCSANSGELFKTLVLRRYEWTASKIEKERLKYAGMSDEVIDDAMTSFILEVLLKRSKISDRICNEDASIFNHMAYFKKLFPNVKFILMIKDARATVTSLINKRLMVTGIDIKSYKQALTDWNKVTKDLYNQCFKSDYCLPVFYEALVLEPEITINHVFAFLNVASLNETLYLDIAINEKLDKRRVFSWLRYFPTSMLNDVKNLAPFMEKLGYNTSPVLVNYNQPSNLTYLNLIQTLKSKKIH